MTGMPRCRHTASRAWWTGIVGRASGTSRGAPTLTKSFCMSTTTTAGRLNRSSSLWTSRGQSLLPQGGASRYPLGRGETTMKRLAILCTGVMSMALASLAGGTPALAGTFVYVSNAEDGDISTFTLKPDGELQAGDRVKAASVVMPMAVSPDRRFLSAASRYKPVPVHLYAIDSSTGGLKHQATSPLAESFPYISLDRTGRFLFGASYAGALVSVNAVGADGRVAADPLQVIPVGRNAHSILVDATNKFVYVPTLGTDQIFQFTFDA